MPDVDDRHKLPKLRIPGIPRTKKLFATVPYTRALLTAALEATDTDVTSFPDLVAITWDFQRRVMGKALSTANSGEPFDILLGHYLI